MHRSSGLTMNIDHTTLPTVPCIMAQPAVSLEPGVSSFVGQEPKTAHADSGVPPKDLSSTVASAIQSGRRARYVLPPGLPTIHNQSPPNLSTPSSQLFPTPPIPSLPASTQQSCQNPTDVDSNLVNSTSSINTSLTQVVSYQSVNPLWFYATKVNASKVWWPFSRHDSYRIESEYLKSGQTDFTILSDSAQTSDPTLVQVEGGRYDVLIDKRERHAVYWDENPTEVRRATWFYRSPDENRVLPFPEGLCESLEAQYKLTLEQNLWGQRFEIPSDDPRGGIDYFIFHNSQSLIQYRAWPYSTSSQDETTDHAGSYVATHSQTPGDDNRICYVHRGLDEQLLGQLDDGEFRPIDHVFFVVHGIGSIHNLRGEGLVECVNDLRRNAREMIRTHFPGQQNRAEFLPILWHNELHSDATGLDEQLNQLTLRSIPKLRQFTNSTLTDILFYTSSKYCQVIVNTVTKSLVRLRNLFLSRNPNYSGEFSIIGHSLGSVIVFDLLAHQIPQPVRPTGDRQKPQCDVDESEDSGGTGTDFEKWSLVGHDEGSECKHKAMEKQVIVETPCDDYPDARLRQCLEQVGLSEEKIRQVLNSWTGKDGSISTDSVSSASNISELGRSFWTATNNDEKSAGFGMPVINYPQLGFPIKAYFMLGSPLPLFLTARGIRSLSTDYRLPTCAMLFNIFHPFDPVAYRMEMLIHPMYQPRAVLMPHHKGRKRFHLQLRDELVRVGSDLKSKIYNSVQSTWKTLQDFAMSHRTAGGNEETSEESENPYARILSRLDNNVFGDREEGEDDAASYNPESDLSFNSQLNRGFRIDYVLQEAPLESFSDYLFALSSHATYWESEDTALFLLNEVYSSTTSAPVALSKQQLQAVQPNVSTNFEQTSTAHVSTMPTQIEASRPIAPTLTMEPVLSPDIAESRRTPSYPQISTVEPEATHQPATLPDVIDGQQPPLPSLSPPRVGTPTAQRQSGHQPEFAPYRHQKARSVPQDSPSSMPMFRPTTEHESPSSYQAPISSYSSPQSFLPPKPPAPLLPFPPLNTLKSSVAYESVTQPNPTHPH